MVWGVSEGFPGKVAPELDLGGAAMAQSKPGVGGVALSPRTPW